MTKGKWTAKHRPAICYALTAFEREKQISHFKTQHIKPIRLGVDGMTKTFTVQEILYHINGR